MKIFSRLREDIQAFLDNDPAATSWLEVLLCYPGLHAVWFHRIGNALYTRGFRVSGRLVSHISRLLTGIEIHPQANIGRRLVIDHGMGIVIGQTASVGDDCVIYQGVALGGTSLERTKRHPTVGNRVMIGSGAKLLGAITVGDDVKVGSNAVVTKNVEAGLTVVGVPAKPLAPKSHPVFYPPVPDVPSEIGPITPEGVRQALDEHAEHARAQFRKLPPEIQKKALSVLPK